MTFTVCDNGMFGQDCNDRCGKCLGKEQCHHVNGSCINGCKPGYKGIMCTKGSQSLPHWTYWSLCFAGISRIPVTKTFCR